MKTTYLAVKYGDDISVLLMEDGESLWTPYTDAQAEIQAAPDMAEAAIRMCDQTPMRGVWQK